MQGTGVKAPLPELSKPPGRLKKWRQDEKSRRKKEVKINVVENTIRCHNIIILTTIYNECLKE